MKLLDSALSAHYMQKSPSAGNTEGVGMREKYLKEVFHFLCHYITTKYLLFLLFLCGFMTKSTVFLLRSKKIDAIM